MGFVFAIDTSWIEGDIRTTRGDVWADDDPVVLAHPGAFTDDPQAHGLLRSRADNSATSSTAAAVEVATAAPGERRNLRPARGQGAERA